MRQMLISVNSDFKRSVKPEDEEIGIISNGFRSGIEIHNMEELSWIVVNDTTINPTQDNGFTWSPGVYFHSKRNNINWLAQDMVTLDFDDGYTPEEFIEDCKRNGIIPNLVYGTFSDSPALRKFRGIIAFDTTVEDKKLRTFLYDNFFKMFPRRDTQCKDFARMFHGGKSEIYRNEELNNLENVINILNLFVIADDKNRTRLCYDSTKNNMYLDINSYTDYIEDTALIQINENNSKFKIIQHYNFDKAYLNINIFKDFLDGKWLHHNQLFGLATNLYWINGGLKVFKKVLNKYNELGLTFYTPNNYAIIPYIQKQKYSPQSLINFSPYKSDWNYSNILNVDKWRKGRIDIIDINKIIKKIPLMEAGNKLKTEFDRVMNSDDTKVYLFKVVTGLGKTTLLEYAENCLIALPTHNLKDEIFDRMKIPNVKKIPRLPIFKNNIINKYITTLYEEGLVSDVYKLISNISNKKQILTKVNVEIIYDSNDVILAKKYINEINDCFKSKNTVLTTHARGIYGSNHNTIIFDEDPIQQVLKIDKITINDIFSFFNTELDEQFKEIFNWLHNMLHECIEPTKSFAFKYDKVIPIAAKLNKIKILKFLHSKFVFKPLHNPSEIWFITKADLPADKKIVIMSATAPIAIYKEMFGDRLEIIEIDNVEQVGKITQHTKHSCSRQGLKTYVNQIKKLVGNLPTITFQEFKDEFDNPVKNMHFGNCSGYNNLTGKNIAVVGTDHKPNMVYFFYASALGISLSPADTQTATEYQLIEWNNFRFKFNTFQHQKLREIQLSLIESEIVQAIGRNRTLRNNCTTDLYSNLPLKYSDEFVY
jgi:hypothetical protein